MGHDGPKSMDKAPARCRRPAAEFGAGGGSLDIQIVSQADDYLDFNLTRCLYAQFYQQMGLADLGYRVHCSRDHSMVVGFSEGPELARSQTLMEGAGSCDFRYRKKP